MYLVKEFNYPPSFAEDRTTTIDFLQVLRPAYTRLKPNLCKEMLLLELELQLDDPHSTLNLSYLNRLIILYKRIIQYFAYKGETKAYNFFVKKLTTFLSSEKVKRYSGADRQDFKREVDLLMGKQITQHKMSCFIDGQLDHSRQIQQLVSQQINRQQDSIQQRLQQRMKQKQHSGKKGPTEFQY